MQPGSSCITSLTESETKPKKIALVEIKGKNFRVNPIVIPNMRKFVFKSIALCNYKQLDPASPAIANDIEAVLDDEMEGILHQIQNEAKLPLVRLGRGRHGISLHSGADLRCQIRGENRQSKYTVVLETQACNQREPRAGRGRGGGDRVGHGAVRHDVDDDREQSEGDGRIDDSQQSTYARSLFVHMVKVMG